MRVAIYTAIIGAYDNLYSPKVVSKDCDYYCFTDQPLSSEVWQVICVSEKNFPLNLNNVKKARYIKTHPHSYRDQLSLNYLIGKYKYKVVISDVVIRYSKYVELIKHNGR